jgi:hypothetical protein
MSDMRKMLNLMESALGGIQPINHVSYVEEEQKYDKEDSDGTNSPETFSDRDEAKQNDLEPSDVKEKVDFRGVDLFTDADKKADLGVMLDAAKKGLALANTLKDPAQRRKHKSRVLGNLNQIRARLQREIKQEANQPAEQETEQQAGDRLWDYFAQNGKNI